MSVMVQIRNIPDELHAKLKARAATARMSLSDYLLRQMEEIAAQPTPEEIRGRLAALPPVELAVSAADLIREQRGPI